MLLNESLECVVTSSSVILYSVSNTILSYCLDVADDAPNPLGTSNLRIFDAFVLKDSRLTSDSVQRASVQLVAVVVAGLPLPPHR